MRPIEFLGEASDRGERGRYILHGLVVEIEDALHKLAEEGSPGLPRTPTYVALLHEHQHFIQDTTTLSGVILFLAYWAALLSIASVNERASTITLPMARDGNRPGTEMTDFWLSLRERIGGDFDLPGYREGGKPRIKDVAYDSFAFLNFPAGIRHNPYPVPSATLVVEYESGTLKFKFGSRAIREFLAASQDEALLKNSTALYPTFPYDAFTHAAAFIAQQQGRVAPTRELLLRFANHSLMTTAPGFFALRYVVEHMRHKAQPIEKTLKKAHAKADFSPSKRSSEALADFDRLTDVLSASPKKKEMFSWFRKHVRSGLSSRKGNPGAFLRSHLGSNPWKECEVTLKDIPVPLILHGGPGFYALDLRDQSGPPRQDTGSDTALYFRQLTYVANLHVFADAPVSCPLFDSCGQDFKGEHCLTTPWQLSDREGDTCATGSAFAALNIKGKPVKIRPSPQTESGGTWGDEPDRNGASAEGSLEQPPSRPV